MFCGSADGKLKVKDGEIVDTTNEKPKRLSDWTDEMPSIVFGGEAVFGCVGGDEASACD